MLYFLYLFFCLNGVVFASENMSQRNVVDICVLEGRISELSSLFPRYKNEISQTAKSIKIERWSDNKYNLGKNILDNLLMESENPTVFMEDIHYWPENICQKIYLSSYANEFIQAFSDKKLKHALSGKLLPFLFLTKVLNFVDIINFLNKDETLKLTEFAFFQCKNTKKTINLIFTVENLIKNKIKALL